MTALHYQSATQLAGLIRRKKIGCLELLNHFLARIEQHNPKLNAIIWMDQDKARKRARAADSALKKDKRYGALHGVPMTIKESYQVDGSPTTWGAPALKHNVSHATAVSAQRMIDAGVTLFGKTNVPLMLADWQSYNDVYGMTRNPVGSRPHTRRLIRWIRVGRARGRPDRDRRRLRHRLLDPQSLCVHGCSATSRHSG